MSLVRLVIWRQDGEYMAGTYVHATGKQACALLHKGEQSMRSEGAAVTSAVLVIFTGTAS